MREKITRVLLVVLLLAVFVIGVLKLKEIISVSSEAKSAISAVEKHAVLSFALTDYKNKTGKYPDEKIYEAWRKLSGGGEVLARGIFEENYNDVEIFKNQNFTLTKNMGFSDGKWIYFFHSGQGTSDIKGLVSKAAPGIDYQNENVSFSELDLLLEYKDGAVTINCLPLTERELKACKKVLNYFRNKKSGAKYIVPQKDLVINEVVF